MALACSYLLCDAPTALELWACDDDDDDDDDDVMMMMMMMMMMIFFLIPPSNPANILILIKTIQSLSII